MGRAAITLASVRGGGAAARWLLAVAAWLLVLSASARADAFRVLSEDRQALQSRVDLIQQAQHEIICVYYAADTGRVPSAILALLRDAAQRGVRVRLLVDGLISRVPAELEAYLISSGIEIRCYHPPRILRPQWLNRRLHDKMLIVDGDQMVIGSRNLKDEHFGLDDVNYVDCDAYVRGAAAAHAKRYFEWLWRTPDVLPVRPRDSLGFELLDYFPRDPDEWSANWRAARTPQDYRQLLDLALKNLVCGYGIRLHTAYDWSAGCATDIPIALLHDTDTRKSEASVQQAMLNLIHRSKHSIWIETPYPVFTPAILEALLAARERGVQIMLLTGSLSSTDRPATYSAFQNLKCTLRRAGVQIWEYLGVDHLHSKSMVIDDRIAVIGSYNFDPRSEYWNLEVSIAAYDPVAAAALKETMRKQLAQAIPVEDCQSVPRGEPRENDPNEPLRFAAKRLRMELTRLVVPAFRWLL